MPHADSPAPELSALAASFGASFGASPEHVSSARGRVNLIGEHTDYNGGFVLPALVPHATTIALRRRPDGSVRVASAAFAAEGVRTFRLGAEARGGDWLDYVQGCTRIAARAGALGGFDGLIGESVPVGCGLSSSAALAVALLRGLRSLFGLPLDDAALAAAAHAAEVDFVGARVGVMDPLACSITKDGAALFLDCATLATESVPLPSGLGLVLLDSRVPHRNAAGGYNARRAECERAAAALGVARLRDLGPGDLARAARLPEPLGRRVRHVVTENARVLAAVAALRAGDLERFGRLMTESHASQRDDYEVSVPAVDRIVAAALAEPDVLGARLTGGGFGGAVVIAVRSSAEARVAARVLDALGPAEPLARVLVP